MPKTIGILAGMGPRSTSPFIERALDECQCQYGAVHDMDFPKMVILSLPTPFYLDRPIDVEALGDAIVDGAKEISDMGIDLLAIPCNTAHQFMESIRSSIQVPVVDMVQLTAGRLKAGDCALLATKSTVASGLFHRSRSDVKFDDRWQRQVNSLIQGVKGGRDRSKLQEDWDHLLGAIRDKGIHQLLIGCTDLSVFENPFEDMQVVDAMAVLAEETVKEWLL